MSSASLLSVASSLLDSQVSSALKGFVADVEAPVRMAAARALALFKNDDTVPFLVAGLLDRSKEVRELCEAALRDQIGPERYEAMHRELSDQSRSLLERLKELGDWARGALSDVEGKLMSLGGAIQAGGANVSAWARGFFDRDRRRPPAIRELLVVLIRLGQSLIIIGIALALLAPLLSHLLPLLVPVVILLIVLSVIGGLNAYAKRLG